MSQYDGLNLPELLALMHEPVVPEAVPWLPQTSGWWIVLGWLLASLVLAVWQIARRRRRNRYRRIALAELGSIEAAANADPAQAAQRIASVLKRTALAAYPRRDVAGLYGAAWARFLTESANNDLQIADAADDLAAAAYRPGADPHELSRPARRWVRLHRA